MCECGNGGKLRRGLCGACYARWLRRQPASLCQPAEVRFWAKVTKTDRCWLWTGATTPKGYGQFSARASRHTYAHRYAYELLVGGIPDGLTIDHLCKTRNCVRPDHMEVVTRGENTRRGAVSRPCNHCGLEVVPANMSRHVAARHVGSES